MKPVSAGARGGNGTDADVRRLAISVPVTAWFDNRAEATRDRRNATRLRIVATRMDAPPGYDEVAVMLRMLGQE